MNEENIRKNSPKAWLLAARPKTLTGCAVPVMIGLALAYTDDQALYDGSAFSWTAAVLCLLFSFAMQIDANFINDFFDYARGNDDASTRLGPLRACTQGWVSIEAMKHAIASTTVLACLVGLPLVYYGGLEMIAVGLLCVVFCFLYTTHLSYLGLGDVLVLLFFGIVPVCATYYIQTGRLTIEAFTASVACGLVIDTLLIVNNYRDRDNDRRTGKMTLVVRIGAKATERLFPALGIVACLLGLVYCLYGHYWAFLLPIVYLSLHLVTSRQMKEINRGYELNRILGENARNMFIYGLLESIGFLLG
jgi:1,4-dihydroxy-2-naphthoate octaprenyltransferase